MPTDYTSVIYAHGVIYRDAKQPKTGAKRFIESFAVAFRATYFSEPKLALRRFSPKAVGPYSRDALSKLPHGIFRPIPLGP